MSGNLSTSTESSLSTTCILNARKLGVKYLAIYSENLSLIRSDVIPYHKIEKSIYSWMKNHNPLTLWEKDQMRNFILEMGEIGALKAERFA